MTTLAVGNRRLLKLADHIESANRGLDTFDFATIYSNRTRHGHPCGTAGCAMGELPVLFPRAFKYYNCDWAETVSLATVKQAAHADPITVRSTDKEHQCDLIGAVADWFGISEAECRVLFIPAEQTGDDEFIDAYDLYPLPERSKAKAVARQIRQFAYRRTMANAYAEAKR